MLNVKQFHHLFEEKICETKCSDIVAVILFVICHISLLFHSQDLDKVRARVFALSADKIHILLKSPTSNIEYSISDPESTIEQDLMFIMLFAVSYSYFAFLNHTWALKRDIVCQLF